MSGSGNSALKKEFQALVLGVSAGGMEALKSVLPALEQDFPLPVLVVQHMSPNAGDFLARHLDDICKLEVKEAEDKETVRPGTVYLAPPNYHLLVDEGGVLRLSVDPKVNYARPSVDVLFETAAEVWQSGLVGVIMTGANNDGAKGLAAISACGGLAVVQSPKRAEAETMPKSALKLVPDATVLPLEKIAQFLNSLVHK